MKMRRLGGKWMGFEPLCHADSMLSHVAFVFSIFVKVLGRIWTVLQSCSRSGRAICFVIVASLAILGLLVA